MKYHKGILHRIYCVSKEVGEVNHKVRYIPKPSIKNKVNLYSPGEGCSDLILVTALESL